MLVVVDRLTLALFFFLPSVCFLLGLLLGHAAVCRRLLIGLSRRQRPSLRLGREECYVVTAQEFFWLRGRNHLVEEETCRSS